MIGRNDLCPCGSGKKYKKCCIGKEKLAQMNIDFKGIMQKFFNAHPTQKEIQDLYRWTNHKEKALSERYDQERLSTILGDAYYFTSRVNIWNEFIEKQVKSSHLSAEISKIISAWNNPLRLFAKVDQIKNNQVILKNILATGEYVASVDEAFQVNDGDYVLAHFVPVFPEEHMLIPLNGVLTLNQEYANVEKEIKELANQYDTVDEFWDDAILEVFYIFGVKQKLEDREMTEKEQQVLYAVYEGMIEMEVKNDKLMAMLIAFMHKRDIVSRLKKIESLAAAVLQYGMDENLLEPVWTKKRLAEFYNVSTSNVRTYEDKFSEFVETEWVDSEDVDYQGIAFEVGTDARPTEYSNWELLMHLREHTIQSENEMKRLIEAYTNVRYEPKNDKEKAQVYAYEAYATNNKRLRENSAKLTHLLDPENADGLLLYAEQHNDSSFYEQALYFAGPLFDDSVDIAWQLVTNRPYLRALYSYGIFLFESGQYDKAFENMNRVLMLNPGDHQGVRYPAVACLIALRRYEDANRLMEHYNDSDNAFFSWFRWVMSRKQNFFSAETEKYYQAAMMDNGYVSKYIREQSERQPFPKYTVITPDSPEEARVIWTLLSPLLSLS